MKISLLIIFLIFIVITIDLYSKNKILEEKVKRYQESLKETSLKISIDMHEKIFQSLFEYMKETDKSFNLIEEYLTNPKNHF